MPRTRIAVVGGTAAGPAAAAQAARTDPDAEVLLIERGAHVSVGSCSIPAYLRGQIDHAGDLANLTPAELAQSRGLDVRVCTDAVRFDAARRHLHLRDVTTGKSYHERVDKLILATGACAIVPDFIPTSATNVTPMRTIVDAARLRRWIDSGILGHVVILGGGYVGADVADALAARGVRATVLEPKGALVTGIVGGELSQVVTQAALDCGVSVRAERATSVRMQGDRAQAVVTDAGEWIGCDAVVLAIGIEVRTELARSAGVKVRADGTLHVDKGGRTNVPGVWACGDAIAVPSAVTSEAMHRPLAWEAFRTGRVVGTNAARRGRGAASTFEASTGASAVEVFGVEAAGVGLRREQAEAAGISVVEATITQNSRVPYDERSAPLRVRLLADAKSGRLIGGELAGRDGTAMRANVLIPLVKSGAHVSELAGLDLVYTPSLAPLHDPLQVAARALVEKLGTAR